MPLGISPLVNFAFVKLFASEGNEPILMAFLNAVLQLRHPIVSLQIKNPFNPKDFQDDKLTILDVKAADSQGRVFHVEMQTVPHAAFVCRIVYYACEIYSDQLREGDSYKLLKPVYSIVIVKEKLWGDTEKVHHKFELIDRGSGRTLEGGIEIHTLELGMYNIKESELAQSSQVDRWLYILLNAEHYTAERLQELFPELEFLQAIAAWEEIYWKTEDKAMYDASKKVERDLLTAKAEGIQIGEERGIQIGELRGKVRLLEEILGLPRCSDEEIAKLSEERLNALITQLQQDLRNRSQP